MCFSIGHYLQISRQVVLLTRSNDALWQRTCHGKAWGIRPNIPAMQCQLLTLTEPMAMPPMLAWRRGLSSDHYGINHSMQVYFCLATSIPLEIMCRMAAPTHLTLHAMHEGAAWRQLHHVHTLSDVLLLPQVPLCMTYTHACLQCMASRPRMQRQGMHNIRAIPRSSTVLRNCEASEGRWPKALAVSRGWPTT